MKHSAKAVKRILKKMGFEFCYQCDRKIPYDNKELAVTYWNTGYKHRICERCWRKNNRKIVAAREKQSGLKRIDKLTKAAINKSKKKYKRFHYEE